MGNLTLEAVLANFSKQQQASAAAEAAPVKEATVAPKFVERSKPPHVSLDQVLASYEKGECSEVDKIYFLKTSKTGSTSVANILTRFGLRRPGTNFLMGEVSNGGFFFKNGFMPFTGQGHLILLLILIATVRHRCKPNRTYKPLIKPKRVTWDAICPISQSSTFRTFTCVTIRPPSMR